MLSLHRQKKIETMENTPIARELIDKTIENFHITDFAKATIREVKAIAAKAEADSGVEFIKMEMGVPGLPPSSVGVKAEPLISIPSSFRHSTAADMVQKFFF